MSVESLTARKECFCFIMCNMATLSVCHHVNNLLSRACNMDEDVKLWTMIKVESSLNDLASTVISVNGKKKIRKISKNDSMHLLEGQPVTLLNEGYNSQRFVYKHNMIDEHERYLTFFNNGWPTQCPVSPSKLAKAGFFYIGEGDKVQCYSCNGRVNRWDYGDSAIGEHKRLFPTCKFVNKADNRNVPVEQHLDKEGKMGPSGKQSSKLESTSTSAVVDGNSDDELEQIFQPLTLEESRPPQQTQNYFIMEINRLLSFGNWPLSSPVDSYDLAAAGFYCVSDTTVQCFACFGRISDWKLGDKPRMKHQNVFPACPFISGQSTGNKPITTAQKNEAVRHFDQRGPPVRQPQQISTNLSDVERLNYSRRSNSQYGRSVHPLELVTSNASDAILRYAKYPNNTYEQDRLHSYVDWPKTHSQQPAQLARAGFFSTGNLDEVKCFFCGGGLKSWDKDDEPWDEHARWFPQCEWLLQQRGPGFVDLIGRKFGRGTASYFQPQMAIPADQSVYQPMSSLPRGLLRGSDEATAFATETATGTATVVEGTGAAAAIGAAATADPEHKPIKQKSKKKSENKKHSKKQTERKQQPQRKDKSITEKIEDLFQSEVVKFMIQMGQEEDLIRAVLRRRLEAGSKPYETSEDLLVAIFEEEEIRNGQRSGGARGSVSEPPISRLPESEPAKGVSSLGTKQSASVGASAAQTPKIHNSKNEASMTKGINKGGSDKRHYPLFGNLKIEVSDNLTNENCQRLSMFLQLTPADCERISRSRSPGLVLMDTLERLGIFSPRDVTRLERALDDLNLISTARIVRNYERSIATSLPAVVEPKEPESTVDPDFEALMANLSIHLTSPNVAMLCVFFGFTLAKRDKVMSHPTPSLAFLRELHEQRIIQPDDVFFLLDALQSLNLVKAARVLSGLEYTEKEEPGDMQSQELEKLREKNLCKICLDKDIEMFFLPCRHLVACEECSRKIDICPICRSDIREKFHVFMP